MLVNLTYILEKAKKEKYAVGAFGVCNMEMVQAVVKAAEEENSPVILTVLPHDIEFAGIEFITNIIKIAADKIDVPVVLHLDHGTSLIEIKRCIRAGFTSVMIDGAKLPLKDNISLVEEVVEFCHNTKVSVEGAVGVIGGGESGNNTGSSFTDTQEAKTFVNETGVDALAVSIGSAHGDYTDTPVLDLQRLKEINKSTGILLVLHGSSGIPLSYFKDVINSGVVKINITTDVKRTFLKTILRELNSDSSISEPCKILGPAREATKELIKDRLRLFGSSGKGINIRRKK